MSYATEVATDTPVHWWRMGSVSGGTVADSGSTPVALTVTDTISTVLGIDSDGAQNFNGTAYCTSVSSSGVPSGASAFTVEAWIKTSLASRTTFLQFGAAATRQSLGLAVDKPNDVFEVWTYGDNLTFSLNLNDNAWHQVVATYDGATALSLYIDGTFAATKTLGGVLNIAVSTISIGRNGVPAPEPYTGVIDEISIYSSVLSPDRIYAHYISSDVVRGFETPNTVIAAAGNVGVFGSATVDIPGAIIAASGHVGVSGTVVLTLDAPSISATGVIGTSGFGDIQLPEVFISAQARVGVSGTAAFSIPVPSIVALGNVGVTGAANIVFPNIEFTSLVKLTSVLNIDISAFTEYTGFEFNSYAKIGGYYYAANEAGLFMLGGNTDAGTAIEARIMTDFLDFGMQAMKRVQHIYLIASGESDLVVTAYTSHDGRRRGQPFEVQIPVSDTLRQIAAPLGRGLVSQLWQFKIANTSGGAFELSALAFPPLRLSRSV